MRTVAFTCSLLLSATLVVPGIAVAAGAGAPSGGGDTTTQSPPAQQKKSHAKRNRSSSVEDFVAGYKAAYALIYDKGEYEAAITALRALDHDDNADVANLIGKLGRYDDAKIWYERSLAADPKSRSDLVVLRNVAGRARQPAQGQGRSGKSAPNLRH